MPQCIAKTSHKTRCKRQIPLKSMSHAMSQYLCNQHDKTVQQHLQKRRSRSQIGGNPINTVLSVMLPSCIDILSCDWITDATSAIPGLSSLISLMRL